MQLVSSDRSVRHKESGCQRCIVKRGRRKWWIGAATAAGIGLAFYAGYEKGRWSIENIAATAEKLSINAGRFADWIDRRDAHDDWVKRKLAEKSKTRVYGCEYRGSPANKKGPAENWNPFDLRRIQ